MSNRLITRPFALLLVVQGAFGFAWSGFLLLPKFVTAELGAQPREVGWLMALAAAAAVACIPLSGRTVDRLGRKPLVMTGCVLAAGYAFGFVLVDRMGPLIYCLQIVSGASFAFAFNAAGALAADLAPRARLGQAMGLFGASNVLMNALAPTAVELVEARWDWHAAFYMEGCAGVLALVLSFWLPGNEPASKATAPAPNPSPLPLGPVLRDALVMASCGGAFGSVFNFYQPYALSLGMTEMRGFFIGYTTSVVAIRVFFGGLIDRVGWQRAATAAIALYGVAVLATTQLSPTTMLAVGLFFGLAHGVLFPAMNALAMSDAAPDQRGRVMAYFNGGFQIGYALSVVCLGWLAEALGFRAVFVAGAGLTLIGLAALLTRRADAHPT